VSPSGDAVIYGSIGMSMAWSAGASYYFPVVELRHLASGNRYYIERSTGADFFSRSIAAKTPTKGEDVGAMRYLPFKAVLPAGDYELSKMFVLKQTPGRGIQRAELPEFKAAKLHLTAGSAAYLGRLSFIPQLRRAEASSSRSAAELESLAIRSVWWVTGFKVWMQDQSVDDRRMTAIEPSVSAESLLEAMRASSPNLYTADVTQADLDHEGRPVN
jgi:hypothetical protein